MDPKKYITKKKTVHVFTARTDGEERLSWGSYLGVFAFNCSSHHVVRYSDGVTVLYDAEKWEHREVEEDELELVSEEDLEW